MLSAIRPLVRRASCKPPPLDDRRAAFKIMRPYSQWEFPRVVWVFFAPFIILNLRTASRNGGSLSDCPSSSTLSAAFHQHFLHGDFRTALSFTFSRLPPATSPHGDFWDPARRRIGWVMQEVVYCYTAGMFSHFSFFFFC